MSETFRRAALRALAFHETWRHAPTRAEWLMSLEGPLLGVTFEDAACAIDALIREGAVCEIDGHCCLLGSEALVQQSRDNEAWMPRKRRRARVVARYLASLSGVRFVALCNASALGHARENGDLDFFVVTKSGVLAATRIAALTPFSVLGMRPRPGAERDAVCLSYFVDETALDLSSHMLVPDDPYFCHWFCSFVPLVDDGVGTELWDANVAIRGRFPFASRWQSSADMSVHAPIFRIPIMRLMEPFARRLQERAFPQSIRMQMNQDTRVIVTDHVLKFHVEDDRLDYRDRYERLCAHVERH